VPERKPIGRQAKATRAANVAPFLVAPNQLPPHTAKRDVWNVVIETPRHSPYKYKYEPRLGAFVMSKVLPEGMFFPYDFGFLPRTKAQDGDPLDVLLFMEEPAFCGCVVPARLIGLIEARQSEKGTTVRNDRLVAVPESSRTATQYTSMKDLSRDRIREIEDFFENYNREFGKRFTILGIGGPQQAVRAVRQALVSE